MTEAENAALDLLREMRQMLVNMHDAGAAKDGEIASLKAQLDALHSSTDSATAFAEVRVWFDSFRSAVAPAPAAPASEPASEPSA
ncbi:MAG: hypothetical protein FJX45_10375 [Alphaproteobacteria bacterium]|nr:hypothetical protein [Alphaproteobacteria bacterium]MBM3655147.1 hypothetical protein [Alphaproteobacteria bacterium]